MSISTRIRFDPHTRWRGARRRPLSTLTSYMVSWVLVPASEVVTESSPRGSCVGVRTPPRRLPAARKQTARPNHRLKSSVKTAVKIPHTIAATNAIAPADIPFHPISRSKEVLPESSAGASRPGNGAKVMFYLYSENSVLSPARWIRRQILRREVVIAIPSLHTRTRERSS
jgi:hypothetical protein